MIIEGVIYLERSQNFPKNKHFLPPLRISGWEILLFLASFVYVLNRLFRIIICWYSSSIQLESNFYQLLSMKIILTFYLYFTFQQIFTCSMSTIETLEKAHWRRSFLYLYFIPFPNVVTLSKYMFGEIWKKIKIKKIGNRKIEN